MAAEELENRQQIAEAKAEEKTYEKFEEEQTLTEWIGICKMLRLNTLLLPSHLGYNLGYTKGAFCEIPKFSYG